MIRSLIVACSYVAIGLLANIASVKIVEVMGVSVDVGTFIYPITFTLRDLLHKTIGIGGARAIVIIAATINLVAAAILWLASSIPGAASVGPQLEFGRVLGPVWRITISGIVAQVIAELIDTEAYRLWVKYVTRHFQWARVLISNAISTPIDSLVFAWGAFGGTMPAGIVVGIVLSNVVIKYSTTVISLPLIYAVPDAKPLHMPSQR